MMKKTFPGLILALLITALPAWSLDMNPGKYEITARVEMPGMPQAMPPQTVTQCLDKQNPVPNANPDSHGCTITDMETKGNTITYTMTCNQQGMAIKSTGRMTFNSDNFEGSARTVMGPQAGGMTMTTKLKGRRIGKCD